MALNIKFHRTRLSLIWIESYPGLLGDPVPPDVPMKFLGNRDLYAEKFDGIQKNGPSPDGLTQPWEKPAGHHFWQYYLEKQPLSGLDGQKFWKFLVPFRTRLPMKISSARFEGRVSHEGYFYPFGFAWILTLDSKKNLTLKDAVQLALKTSKLPFRVRLPNGKEEQLETYPLAEKYLTLLRESALGPGAAPGSMRANEPFTVFTVIQGSGTIPPGPPAQGGEIHQLLEALTTWNPALARSWGSVPPPALDAGVLPPLKRGTPQTHAVYAQKRGRAVWFPEAFTDIGGKRSTLSCYHRNLSLTALHVESLSAFLKTTASEIKNGRWEHLPLMQKECARLAAGIAGRMYGDVEETYRSLSPRYHIDQNKYASDINLVRNRVDLTPLAKPAQP